MKESRKDYVPPDPARIDAENPDAVRKVGPMLEQVKRELGIGGVG